ncbi:MAG: hypothetical protein IPJ16_16950 [Bacteroidales bacterium]|nr:hypothetical protein [Bacteroidales bacterium]
METKEKKSFVHYIRLFHRYLGFFFVGFVIIYAMAGISLIFRDTDFLKKEKTVKTTVPADTKPADLGTALRLREFKILKTEGDIVYFQGGTFNTATGTAEMTVKELIFPLNRFANIHKTASKNPFHWVTLAFGIVMLFLAVSSFWMFNAKSKVFRNGLYVILAGFVFAILLLLFYK